MPTCHHQYMAERDIPSGMQVIPAWKLSWEEPKTLDGYEDVSMAPKVSLSYIAWWLGAHPVDLGMDEDEEKVAASEGSLEDDPYQVNNLMNDVPVQEEGGGVVVLGLAVLAEATPLATLGKTLNYLQHVFYLYLCKKKKLIMNFINCRRDQEVNFFARSKECMA